MNLHKVMQGYTTRVGSDQMSSFEMYIKYVCIVHLLEL